MAEIIQINSNTWSFEDGFVRFFLLEGKDKAVLIDSGANCPDAANMAKALTNKPIILLNTHGDVDHISGTDSFDKIYMHEEDYTACGINATYPKTALVKIVDGDLIDLGERVLKIIHIPGHTKGSVAVLDISNRILYAGDSVQMGYIYMFGRHRMPGEYEKSLDKLISIKEEYDWIYASHDELVMPNDYVQKVKDSWKQVQNGEVNYEIINLFGMDVKSYTADACGFYTE